MADIAVQSSTTSGDCGSGSTSFQTPSQNVMKVNGQLVVCVGDNIIPHGHDGTVIQGSSVMKINGRPVAFVSCAIDCGDKIATGDATVQVNS